MATPSSQSPTTPRLEAGHEALAEGRWQEAVDLLRVEVDTLSSQAQVARAFSGLSEALWWLGRHDEALTARVRAYESWRRAGDDDAAARAAAWLAVEHATTSDRWPVANGWLARARTLAERSARATTAGWVALGAAAVANDPASQAAAAEQALAVARVTSDGELEVRALGRLGVATVAGGDPEAGLRHLDEAMAAATGGDAGRETVAALCCDLVRAAEISGEAERFAPWQEVIATVVVEDHHPPLIAFCATCCAETFAAAGDWTGAERELRSAVERLRRSGHATRCVEPTAKLADLLVAQGRLEEAERVLVDQAGDDTLVARARLALQRGDAAAAAALARRHLRRAGGASLATTPAMALLIDALVAADRLDEAQDVADQLSALAVTSGHRRSMGRAALARSRLARHDPKLVEAHLEEALDHLTVVAPGGLETAEAQLELARVRAEDAPGLATAEAKAALAGFEAAGAAHRADEAAALLRRLGDRSRVGAKDVGALTRREQEVLRLVAEGLSNRELAQRLFISSKTASNHVSHILTKLGVRTRAEAAAYAAREAGDGQNPGRRDRR